MTAPKTLFWDEHEITQSKMREYLESGIAATETEAHDMAASDHELLEYEYEDFLEAFGDILRHISKDGLYFVEGRNMGWRQLSGHLGLAACDARAFITRTFPRTTEWTLKGIYDRRRRVLSYTLWHHDAPTREILHPATRPQGSLWRYRRTAKEREGLSPPLLCLFVAVFF